MRDTEFVWDEKETRAVRFSFIRNFTLELGRDCVNVVGWFNDAESFKVKSFRNYEEAQEYVRKLVSKD